MALVLLGFIVAITVLSITLGTYRSRTLRARLRMEWGKPRAIERDMNAIAGYHEGRTPSDEMVVDARTWSDLTMDAIFALVDRTESAIGRQVLYERLHTLAPNDRDQFESAVNGLGDDTAARERAQRPGPARTRNAIALLEIEGAPSELVEKARRRAKLLDSRSG